MFNKLFAETHKNELPMEKLGRGTHNFSENLFALHLGNFKRIIALLKRSMLPASMACHRSLDLDNRGNIARIKNSRWEFFMFSKAQ